MLEALAEMWPEAPIYTAFAVPGSSAVRAFAGKKIITSWFGIFRFITSYTVPCGFNPWIWGSFDFSQYDLVITSSQLVYNQGPRKKRNFVIVIHHPDGYMAMRHQLIGKNIGRCECMRR